MSRSFPCSSFVFGASLAVFGLLFLSVNGVSASAADQWANLSGRFVYDGPAPTPVKLVVSKDVEVCGKHPLVDESLVVGPDGGLANVAVYVSTPKVKVHPDLAKPEGEVVIDNKNCRFEPHIVPIQIGQTLRIKNSDSIGHNTNVTPLGDQGTNPLIAAGKDATHKFNRKQSTGVPVQCNIHPWMKAYVLPRDNPYAAVTDEDGNFTIENLPAGASLEFQVWQEKAGYLKPDGTNGTKKDTIKMTLKPGDNDLGVIKVKPAAFKK